MLTYPIGLLNSKVTPGNAFELSINTALGTGTTITLPLPSGETYDFWWTPGDGAPKRRVTAFNDANITYDYGVAFSGQIAIGVNSGDKCGGFSFNNLGDKLKVTSVDNWGDVGFDYVLGMLYGCINNTSIAADIDWINSISDLTRVFQGNSLTSLPSGMVLTSTINGFAAFFGNPITSLPSGMVLANLDDARFMFQNCSLASVPAGMLLTNLTVGTNMFSGNSLSTTSYSQLINNIDANNSNSSVFFHGGSSNYNSSAQAAHDNLTGVKLWAITDNGFV